jgi:hypothetical protein
VPVVDAGDTAVNTIDKVPTSITAVIIIARKKSKIG